MRNNVRRPVHVSPLRHLDIVCLTERQTDSMHVICMNIAVKIDVADFHPDNIVRSVDDRNHPCRAVV